MILNCGIWRRLLRVLWTARRVNHLTGNQSWIFIGRTDAEAETPVFWPPDAKNWLIWKDPDDGKDWGQDEKGTTEDEMVGWHHRINGHEFEYTPGVVDGQGSLACCRPWGGKELDTTEWLNWTDHVSNQLVKKFLRHPSGRLHLPTSVWTVCLIASACGAHVLNFLLCFGEAHPSVDYWEGVQKICWSESISILISN